MEGSRPYRPHVSRETRLLLTAVFLAVAALWVLARIRFPDRPVTPNPVPPLLTQIASGPKFDDLASEISQVQARLESSLFALNLSSPEFAAKRDAPLQPVAALRLRDDLAVTLIRVAPDQSIVAGPNAVTHDSGSGLTLVRMSGEAPVSELVPWSPRRFQQPRYLMASDVSSERVSLRPVFIGSLDPVESPVWPEPIWLVPTHTDLTHGTFVFSSNGELAGLVVRHGAEHAIVPGEVLLAEADRLLKRDHQPAGDIGVRVQSLTPDVASATGARAGVVVAWVDQNGPAAGKLTTADVIEAADGQPMTTPQHWQVRLARLAAGETLTLRVRRASAVQQVQIVAPALVARPATQSLGLTMRRLPGLGAEIVRVQQASAADRAGLRSGDVISFIEGITAPTPAQVRAVFASARDGQPVLLGRMRGDTHDVMTLAR